MGSNDTSVTVDEPSIHDFNILFMSTKTGVIALLFLGWSIIALFYSTIIILISIFNLDPDLDINKSLVFYMALSGAFAGIFGFIEEWIFKSSEDKYYQSKIKSKSIALYYNPEVYSEVVKFYKSDFEEFNKLYLDHFSMDRKKLQNYYKPKTFREFNNEHTSRFFLEHPDIRSIFIIRSYSIASAFMSIAFLMILMTEVSFFLNNIFGVLLGTIMLFMAMIQVVNAINLSDFNTPWFQYWRQRRQLKINNFLDQLDISNEHDTLPSIHKLEELKSIWNPSEFSPFKIISTDRIFAKLGIIIVFVTTVITLLNQVYPSIISP